MIQPDVQLESQLNLMSDVNELKLDSINFSLSKQPKNQDGFKLELNEEVSLQLDQTPGSLMDALLPN